jgi:hypothetical protein
MSHSAECSSAQRAREPGIWLPVRHLYSTESLTTSQIQTNFIAKLAASFKGIVRGQIAYSYTTLSKAYLIHASNPS